MDTARTHPDTAPSARLGIRIRHDPQLLLAFAVALPVVAMEGPTGMQRSLGLLGPASPSSG